MIFLTFCILIYTFWLLPAVRFAVCRPASRAMPVPSKSRFEQLEKLQLALKAHADRSEKADSAPVRGAPPVPESMCPPSEPPKKRMKTKTAPAEPPVEPPAEPAPKTPPTTREKNQQEKLCKERVVKKEKDAANGANAAGEPAGNKSKAASVAADAVSTAPPSNPKNAKRCADGEPSEPRPAAKAKAAKVPPSPLQNFLEKGCLTVRVVGPTTSRFRSTSV